LELSDRHREILKNRGFTDTQIDSAGYRSVKQWQKLDNPVSNRLSGVKWDGLSLINHTDGILIPVPNEDGLYTHVRVNDCSPDTTHKYYPLSSAKRGVKYHLASGEQPVAVYLPDKPPEKQIIGFTEGLEYKPLLASFNLGIPVIGASGGNFASSREAIETAIAHVKSEVRSSSLRSGAIAQKSEVGEDDFEFVLYADAGSIINSHVALQYQKLGEFLPNLKIADWGQLEDQENGLDIDEVDVNNLEITLITINEFKEESDKLIYQQKAFSAWKSCKQLTPTKTVDQDYLDLPVPPKDSITAIKSGLGTGKTTNLIKWLEYLENYGVVSLGYRNSLLLQFANKAKFTHIHEKESSYSIRDCRGKVTACINSHHRFNGDDFDGKVLILDEVVSVLKQLLFSKTVKHREQAIDLIKEAIIRSSRVAILDGNLADPYIEFIKAVDPTKTIEIVKNTHKGKKPKLVLLEGTIKKTKLRKRDHSPWLYDLITVRDMVGAIASDSQTLLESLDKILSKLGFTTFRVDGKTINSPEVKKFLEDPNKYLKENPIHRFLFSPSCESGLDINISNYFTHFFGLFFGQLDADSITQIIARIRDTEVTRYLWINPFTKVDDSNSIKSPFLEKLQYHFDQRLKRDLHLAMAGENNQEEFISEILTKVKEDLSSPESQLAQRLEAMINYEKANLRKCVYWLLEQQGYDISNQYSPEHKEHFKKANQKVSKEKIETKYQNSKDIFSANNKYVGKPWMMLNQDASWPERCALMKAKLIQLLPNIQDSSFWNPELIYLIKYKYPNLITQLENRIYLEKFDQENSPALVKAKRFYHNLLTKVRNSKLCPWKIQPRYLFLKGLYDLRLLYFIEVAGEFTADSEVVRELIKRANLKKIWQGLGKRPGKDPIKFVRWVLNQIGYDLSDRRLSDEKRTRVYKVVPMKINVLEVVEDHKHDNYVYGVINKLNEVIEQRINRDYNPEQLETLRWDDNNPIQQPPSSTEFEPKNPHQTHESKSDENPGQPTRINDPDVPITVIEDPPHLDHENIVQSEPNPNLDPHPNLDPNPNSDPPVNCPSDINIWEIESVGEVPLEAISFEDRQFIADLIISYSTTVEEIKVLRDESRLTKEQLQLGWDLLPSSEKERLRPLFAQLNQPEPDPFPIGQKIKARLQHFTGQWMRLIGEVVEFLTNSGDRLLLLRTADGWEYPLSCLEDIQPLSWSERMGFQGT
ncbi:plasmid replication protein, CyRepA1 family, partial [Crocosphaera watsonii]|uniref:plasmid replication protein, CyRepA1 family n=1 Tax=Crocosphaera watsonii TaxID=263511 RepID=UPI000651ED0C